MYSHIFGHVSLTTIRHDFGYEFTGGKFPNPPKFVVDLPQSVLECVFNAQLRQKLTNDYAHAMGTVIAFTDLRVGGG